MRFVVAADSDSYVKWAVARAAELPAQWQVSLGVVTTAVTPTASQLADAGAGSARSWTLGDLMAELADADGALLAMRGPLVEVVVGHLRASGNRRPALAAGIPGIWFPPTERGLVARDGVDVMIVHSMREREAVRTARPSVPVGLARIATARPSGAGRGNGAVVFAPQALVPAAREDRLLLLAALAATASSHPKVPVIVKVRGREGDAQTHRDLLPYEALARELGPLPANLSFQTGALADFLGGARGFATVSSTAAIEAVAAGVPSLILGDFGVGPETITEVFRDSGLIGSLADLEALAFREPAPGWAARNYLHEARADDWVSRMTEAMAAPERRRDQVAHARWRALAARHGALGSAEPLPGRLVSAAFGVSARFARRNLANLRFRSLRLRKLSS